jgi:uncharacterized cupin superfamily protein
MERTSAISGAIRGDGFAVEPKSAIPTRGLGLVDNRCMAAVNIFSAMNLDGRIDVATAVGSTATAMYIYDLAPAESSSPYPSEYAEEWLLVVDGTVVVRVPDGERTLERGDLVCFPAGPAGAHKVMNRSQSPARTLLFSNAQVPAVSVYPDSNKIGVWPGDEENALIFRRSTAVPWSDGEEGYETAV